MDVRIDPGPLAGTVEAVTSKSQAHRLLIAAALGDKPVTVRISQTNEDIGATARCLEALGAKISRPEPGQFAVTPIAAVNPAAILDCGESGTTLRLLLPLAAALGGETTFTGAGRLPQRPLSPLPELLWAHGCKIEGKGLPLTLSGGVRSGVYALPGNISSQYISGLLFALPLLDGDSEIILETPLESAGYVAMSLDTLRLFGIEVHETKTGWRVPGNQRYKAPGESITAEGDWSGAAFYLAAGAVAGDITCLGLDPGSRQGDRAIIEILQKFGAKIDPLNVGLRARSAPLKGCVVDVSQVPDLLPVLAAVAAVAQGETRLINAARLRLKESDRLTATARALGALGAEIYEEPDALRIVGKPALAGGETEGFSDHRIVMAAAVAAARCRSPVTIRGAQAVHKSYPLFFDHYAQVGGSIHVF